MIHLSFPFSQKWQKWLFFYFIFLFFFFSLPMLSYPNKLYSIHSCRSKAFYWSMCCRISHCSLHSSSVFSLKNEVYIITLHQSLAVLSSLSSSIQRERLQCELILLDKQQTALNIIKSFTIAIHQPHTEGLGKINFFGVQGITYLWPLLLSKQLGWRIFGGGSEEFLSSCKTLQPFLMCQESMGFIQPPGEEVCFVICHR